jgi:hypothetical protein
MRCRVRAWWELVIVRTWGAGVLRPTGKVSGVKPLLPSWRLWLCVCFGAGHYVL